MEEVMGRIWPTLISFLDREWRQEHQTTDVDSASEAGNYFVAILSRERIAGGWQG